jgi:hypothetical protein
VRDIPAPCGGCCPNLNLEDCCQNNGDCGFCPDGQVKVGNGCYATIDGELTPISINIPGFCCDFKCQIEPCDSSPPRENTGLFYLKE